MHSTIFKYTPAGESHLTVDEFDQDDELCVDVENRSGECITVWLPRYAARELRDAISKELNRG